MYPDRVRTLFLAGFAIALACNKSSDATAPADAAPPEASAPAASSAAPTASVKDDPLGAILANEGPVLREEKDVVVDGVTEKWRLEWKKAPVPDCVSADFETCACAGFAFGEKGDLDLVRSRPGQPEDRMALGPLFDAKDARVRRWAPNKGDSGKKPDIASLVMRPVESVMKLGDYDHDGRATELVLQVEASACGHSPSVVVGISKSNPKLHAFATVEKPKEPVTLERPSDWEQLKAKPNVVLTTIACGDHGADQETAMQITADGELHVKTLTKPCK